MTKEIITRGTEAYNLNRIIMAMNNEGAYWDSSWTWFYCDGCDLDEAIEYYGRKKDFEELCRVFRHIYKYYHKDGLYTDENDIIELAHKYDNIMNLEPIEIVK